MPPDFAAQIAAVKAQASGSGRDVIDLASEGLDLPLPLAAREALCRIVSEPSATSESVSARTEFHQSVANWFVGRFGVPLNAESEITQTAGSRAGWAQTLWSCVNPGDVVLVPELAAPWVKGSVLLTGGVPHDLPLQAQNGWMPDLTAIAGDVVQQARLLYLNSPHNPTGARATPSFFRDATNFAQETGVTIFHDATYARLGSDDDQALSLLECAGARNVALELHSLPFGPAVGGMAIMVGNADAVRAIDQVKAVVNGDVPTVVTQTATWALNNASWDETPAALVRRRAVLVDGLKGLGWNVGGPQGGPFVWLPVPTDDTSASFAQRLMERADVLTLPGLAFGPAGDGFVRLSLAVSEERIGEAVRRMSRIL